MIETRKCQKLNPIIAEIKVHSPMYGDMLGKRKVTEVLRMYESCEVAAISYITAREFNGSKDVLKMICKDTDLPVLRKDFILTRMDVEETATLGANSVLLIARMLRERTPEFADMAEGQGLEPLVEVHSYEDIKYANESSARMIAINNRDISMFERDGGNVTVSESLYHYIGREKTIVSASGLQSLEDLRRALAVSDAALVGSAFMRADETESIVRSFVRGYEC